MNIFRLTILGIFAIFIVLGVLMFAGVIPVPGGGPAGVSGTVELWGTIPEAQLREPIRQLNNANEDVFQITYTQKSAATFDTELVEALASGAGPDMILLPNDLIIRHADKVIPIPYENISARTFRDTYVGTAEVYLQDSGILALPLTIDPMVLYWNRDIYASAGVATQPDSWEQFFSLAQRITEEDEARNISRSAIALGSFDNITHAKDILAMLTIQAGDPIIQNGARRYAVVYGGRFGITTTPAESALRFYTEFSNPSRTVYSWNRALPESRDMFAAGDLATYLGYASEAESIQNQSPNLDFDVAIMPQTQGVETQAALARLTGVAVLRRSDNTQTAFHAAFQLAGREFQQALTEVTGLPPVRRAMLDGAPDDPFAEIFHQSALLARTWLDPRPVETDAIFREMIQDVVSGRATVGTAVSRAAEKMRELVQ